MSAGWRSYTGLIVAALCCFAAAGWLLIEAGLPRRGEYTGLIQSGQNFAPEIGALAPLFEAPQVDGTSIQLTALRGSPVIVNFWATWCPPCIDELPLLEQLYQEYRAEGLQVVAVNMAEPESQVREWVSALDLNFPVVLDPQDRLRRLYYVIGQPSTYVISPDGTVSAIFYGPVDEERLRASILLFF
jgi:peroxiredoxin